VVPCIVIVGWRIQRDATVCRYSFTAKLLYMFRASIAPITSIWNCSCSLYYRSYYLERKLPQMWRNKHRSSFGHVWGSWLPRYYDLYQRLQLQFYVLLTMGTMDARKMCSNLAVNKYLHTVASRWFSSTQINSSGVK